MDISRNCLSIFLIIIFGAILLACGKSSNPVPPGGLQEFHWTWTRAEIVNQCLAIQGGLEGNMDNFYEVVLELQPSGPDDLCIDCPFLPVERESFSLRAANFRLDQNHDTATAGSTQAAVIALTYCPEHKAPSYQWRLLGVHVNQIAPYALTPVQYITLPSELE